MYYHIDNNKDGGDYETKGTRTFQPIFPYFNVEDLVPQDHILRMIDKSVDFSFTHKLVEGCYCSDNGRPGVDPEVSGTHDSHWLYV